MLLRQNIFILTICLLSPWLGYSATKSAFNHEDYAMLSRQINTQGLDGLKLPDLSRFHIIFVGGFMNEIAPGYFEVPATAVSKIGAAGVTILMPSSSRSVEENRALLREALVEVQRENAGKQIIAVGHSKGGVELIATLLAFPELLTRGIVNSIVAVQSPLTSCYLATCSSELLKWTKKFPMLSGGHSLSSPELKRMILDPLKKLPKKIREDISRQVFYVISEQQASQTARAIVLGNQLIYAGTKIKNDGLVEINAMSIQKFGEVLAKLQADHMELLVSWTLRGMLLGLNTPTDSKNQAFTYLLMKSLLAKISSLESINRSCQTVFY